MTSQPVQMNAREWALELLPARKPCGRPPLFLLHGWGHSRACWQPLLPSLQQEQDVYLLDLPGFGANSHCLWPDLQDVLDEIGQLLPEKCIVLGWSLGGNLALKLARQLPARVAAVITLAANLRFVADTQWPHAMPKATFTAFQDGFRAAPDNTVKRFCALQAQGDIRRKTLLKDLREQCPAPEPEQQAQWLAALGWLAEIDHRDDLPALGKPLLQLFGAEDALVPAAAGHALATKGGETAIVEGAGHALHMSHTAQVAELIEGFLTGLCTSGTGTSGTSASEDCIDKQRMARSFSRAASTYDSAAHVQTRIGHRLLQECPATAPGAPVLDLGCGTGFCTQHLLQRAAQVTALDIAPGMLQQAKQKLPQGISWVCADAERLPFAEGRFQGVVSNLTLQWSQNLRPLFAGLAEVVAPDGWLLFSTLGPETLYELRRAWQAVDGYTHVNAFASREAVELALTTAGFTLETFVEETVVPRYSQLNTLMHELKALGAHNVNSHQNQGLTSPRDLRQLARAYEQFRQVDGQLPATYQVFYVLARKP